MNPIGSFNPISRPNSEETTLLRHRKVDSKEAEAENIQNEASDTFAYEDKLFSSPGEGWELYKLQDYKTAFNHLYLRSINGECTAQYLIAGFYEQGLGPIFKSA